MAPLRVLIFGGGVGGASLAHGLLRSGAPVDVHVFEHEARPTSGLHGYRIGISERGAQALQALLPEDLFKMFLHTCALPPRHLVMVNERFKRLLCMRIASVPPGVQEDDNALSADGEHSVSRMNLRQVLFTGLGGSLHLDKTFSRYEVSEKGGETTVTAHFTDGTSVEGDILIGADGARSAVRRQFLPDERLHDTGIIAIAAKFPLELLTDAQAVQLPAECKRAVTMAIGQHGVNGIMHAMAFRDRSALPKELREKYSELLDRCAPSMQSWAHWAIWCATDKLPSNVLELRGQDVLGASKGLARSQGWSPDMLHLIDASDPSSAFSLKIRTSAPKKDGWPTSEHGITLLGDACHTMTPGLGIGANTALRDAQQLADKLIALASELRCDTDAPLRGAERQAKVKRTLAEYEAEMRSYAYPAIVKSRQRMDASGWEHRYAWYSALLYWFMCTLLCLADRSSGLKELMRRMMMDGRGRDD